MSLAIASQTVDVCIYSQEVFVETVLVPLTGQANNGLIVSTTSIVYVHWSVLPEISVTIQSTCVVPKLNTVFCKLEPTPVVAPDRVYCKVMLQLSVAVASHIADPCT